MNEYQITSQIETITPAIAAEYLKNNETNRPLSQATVKSYSETMKRGEWLLNGESIDFDWNGNLLNGQHRLQAVVNSGITIQTFVVRNLNPNVYTSYDCGRSRTAGQLIGMQGVPHYNIVAACVKIADSFKNGRMTFNTEQRTGKMTNYIIVDKFEKDRDNYVESSKFAVSVRSRFGANVISPSYIAGIHYHLIHNLNHNKLEVEYFIQNILSFETSNNAMLDTLRIRFLRDNSNKVKMTNEYKMRLIIKVWNAFVDGVNLKIIKWDKESEGSIMFK